MDLSKLAKVLALAGSDNEAEALHALRTAQRLLAQGGMDFVELSKRLDGGGVDTDVLHDAIFDLRNEVRHLRAENEKLRQAPAGAAGPVSGLAEASRDAAQIIRLQAEVAKLSQDLEVERAQVQRLTNQDQTRHHQFQEALAEADRLNSRVADLDARRMRLEAENRRLSLDNNALRIDLEQARQTPAPLPPSLPSGGASASESKRAAKVPHASRPSKQKGKASQFALF